MFWLVVVVLVACIYLLELPLGPQPIFEGFCILNANIYHLPEPCVVKSDHTY